MAKAIENVPQQPENAEKTDTQAVRHPKIVVPLVGRPGTQFGVIAQVARALRKAKVPNDQISEFMQEAAAGDHTKLLATVLRWVSVQ